MHTEVLGKKTAKGLEVLTAAGILEPFYLAGGTALALHLGHRLSHDLDFFTPKPFNPKEIAKKISALGNFSNAVMETGTLHGTFDGVKLSFLHYPYRLIAKTVRWSCAIAGVKDIACMKVDAVSNRGVRKDFVDLYFILERLPLTEIMMSFEKKYEEIDYNMLHILKSLTYFDSAETDPDPEYIGKSIPWQSVKNRLQMEVRKIKV